MAVNALNTNIYSLRSLKKRELRENSQFDDYFSNNIVESEDASIDIEYIKKENDETPTEKKYDNNTGKTNVLQHSDSNNKVTKDTQSSLISIRKFEDLCTTPTRNKSINESINRNSIKKENTSSPLKFSPSISSVPSAEWNSVTVKSLHVISTPDKKRKLYNEEPSTLAKRKNRKVSDIGENDQLPDSVKAELYDDTLNNMEHIEMLHDLDSVMGFEDAKISIFLSSTTNDMLDEENIDVSKDPQVDPLSIDKHDVSDAFVKKGKRKQYKMNLNRKNCLRNKRKNVVNTSNEKLNETPSGIKIALGELDIQSDTENEELSEDTRKRVYDFKVQLTHDVPPQHKLQSNLSKSMTRIEKKQFLQYTPLRKGSFLPHEDEIIENNWKKFCEVHDWNPKIIKPFLFKKNGHKYYIRSAEERQKFVQYLANGLPCRSLNSVLARCKTLFIKNEKCSQRYCTAEDEIILSYMKRYKRHKKQNNHFSKLAQMLKRKRHSVWLRYKKLKNMQSSRTNKPILEVEWTLELVGEFIQNLMEIALCEEVEELKNATIPMPIWLKLEEKLNINLNVLRGFWILQLHMQLFCPEPIYLNDIKIKLIEYIYGKGISNTREIIWPSVARYFDGFTTIFLCKVFFYLVQDAVNKLGANYFPDVIEYLYNSQIRKIRNSYVDKFLPRLSYKDREVQIVDQGSDHYMAKRT